MVYHKLWMIGITDSAIFCHQYYEKRINKSLWNSNYTTLLSKSLLVMKTTINDVLWDPSLSVNFSFHLEEDQTLITLVDNEVSLIKVLQSSTIFVHRCCPVNWCNCVLRKLGWTGFNTVQSLHDSIVNHEVNDALLQKGLPTLHQVTLDALCLAMKDGFLGSIHGEDVVDFHLGWRWNQRVECPMNCLIQGGMSSIPWSPCCCMDCFQYVTYDMHGPVLMGLSSFPFLLFWRCYSSEAVGVCCYMQVVALFYGPI